MGGLISMRLRGPLALGIRHGRLANLIGPLLVTFVVTVTVFVGLVSPADLLSRLGVIAASALVASAVVFIGRPLPTILVQSDTVELRSAFGLRTRRIWRRHLVAVSKPTRRASGLVPELVTTEGEHLPLIALGANLGRRSTTDLLTLELAALLGLVLWPAEGDVPPRLMVRITAALSLIVAIALIALQNGWVPTRTDAGPPEANLYGAFPPGASGVVLPSNQLLGIWPNDGALIGSLTITAPTGDTVAVEWVDTCVGVGGDAQPCRKPQFRTTEAGEYTIDIDLTPFPLCDDDAADFVGLPCGPSPPTYTVGERPRKPSG
jgi:hypothetical protein